LGTTYGGNGQTTFGLPDLRGRAPLHSGSGPGLTPRSLGESGGAENVTLQTTQLPAHTHAMLGDSSGGGLPSPSGNTWGKKAARSPTPLYQSGAPAAAMSQGALTTTGGSQPHNNLSPYTTLNFIICLQGIYPSRN
jgi:microcystin-dependent protein